MSAAPGSGTVGVSNRTRSATVHLSPRFDDDNAPPAIEPIFLAGAVFIVAVLLIVALLVGAAS